MKERIKFIIKLIIKIILAILCLIILHYLFKDKFLEFTGIWSFVEKILLCLLAYGIHLLVEWIANKKFPSDKEDAWKSIYGTSKNDLELLMESLSEDQLLWFTEKKKEKAHCILTLDSKVFDLNLERENRLVMDFMLLTVKDKAKCEVTLFLSISDSEETLIKKAKSKLPKNNTSQMHKINTLAGEVMIQTSDQADKDRTYMTIFVYKVRENLYFDGEFWLPEDSSLSADEIVSAIFQKVECC